MNIELNPQQTSVKNGDINSWVGNSDFTGKENFLTKLATVSTVPTIELPAAATDTAFYVVMSGDISGQPTSVEVPNTGDQCRLKAYGTGNAGDLLILADPTANSGAQAGMVRSFTGSHAPSSSSGTYFVFGYAEEVFIDGQFVLARFIPGYKVS